MQPPSAENAAVSLCEDEFEVQRALDRLRRSGFDIAKVSVAGMGQSEHQSVGLYAGGGKVKYWGNPRSFWGELSKSLKGCGLFWMPEIGPVVVAGPLAAWISAGLENEPLFEGLSAIAAAIYSIGISRDKIAEYETALKREQYLVLVYGTASEIRAARTALEIGVEAVAGNQGEP